MVTAEQMVYVLTVVTLALGVAAICMTVTHPRKWKRHTLAQNAVSLVISLGLFIGTTFMGLSLLTIFGVI